MRKIIKMIMYKIRKLWVGFIYLVARCFWRICYYCGLRLTDISTVVLAVSMFQSFYLPLDIGQAIVIKVFITEEEVFSNFKLVLSEGEIQKLGFSYIITHEQANKINKQLTYFSADYLLIEYSKKQSPWQMFWNISTEVIGHEIVPVVVSEFAVKSMGLSKIETPIWLGNKDQIFIALIKFQIFYTHSRLFFKV